MSARLVAYPFKVCQKANNKELVPSTKWIVSYLYGDLHCPIGNSRYDFLVVAPWPVSNCTSRFGLPSLYVSVHDLCDLLKLSQGDHGLYLTAVSSFAYVFIGLLPGAFVSLFLRECWRRPCKGKHIITTYLNLVHDVRLQHHVMHSPLHFLFKGHTLESLCKIFVWDGLYHPNYH